MMERIRQALKNPSLRARLLMALAALAAALAVKCFALSVSGIFLAVAVINAMNAVYSLKLLRSPARRHQ